MIAEKNTKKPHSRYFLPYDIYERHRKVGQYIDTDQSILDVGGELGHLSQFINANKIVVANLTTGDIIIKKNELPFSENSFDIVCSIDVLEHVPKKSRQNFINRLYQVSKKRVILSFPIGTEHHIAYEKEIKDYLKNKGIDVTYLNEHIKNGLPEPEEIKQYTKNYKTHIYYSGNIFLNRYLFKMFLFDPRIRFVRKIIYWAKLLGNCITNPLFYFFLSEKKFSGSVNRAYVIIDKI